MIDRTKMVGKGLAIALGLSLIVVPMASAAPPPPIVVEDFESGLPQGQDGSVAVGYNTFQDPNSTVSLTTTDAPPAPVPGAAAANTVAQLVVDVVSYAGFTHSLTNETADQWVPEDWSAYEGISFWMYGNNSGTSLFVDVLDNRTDPAGDRDDAERFSVAFVDDFTGWQLKEFPFASMSRKDIGNGAPNDGFGLTEIHGWALGSITTDAPQTYYVDDVTVYGEAPERALTAGFSAINYSVVEGQSATITVRLSKPADTEVGVSYRTSIGYAVADEDYTPVEGRLIFAPGETQKTFSVATLDDAKHQGDRAFQVELFDFLEGLGIGQPPVARVLITDDESVDPTLIEDFESEPFLWSAESGDIERVVLQPDDADAQPGQTAAEGVLRASGDATFGRKFAGAQDWSSSETMQFWYYGRGDGSEVDVTLTNSAFTNQEPADWPLVWSDEFDGAAGTLPNTDLWRPEIGDGTVKGIPGWGNDERQYYTFDPENVAMDGDGNLAITVRRADGGEYLCYYGSCEYTSARLITQDRYEVQYGRIEARVEVPTGGGLWPAFWMLDTDIDEVAWPQSGEIDVMEHVGRLPNEIFGTLHGPGYSGGQSYGRWVDTGAPVAGEFHTYAIDWMPDRITWLFDGEPFFTATPDDPFLEGKEWVYNDPFFLLMNVAIGGNFGGTIDPDLELPASTLFDYVRVYQPTTVDNDYTASFTDSAAGWQLVTVPFASFEGEGALDRTAISAIRFDAGQGAPIMLDQLKLSCADNPVVTTASDSGAGSLRAAVNSACAGSTITFDDALAGETIRLTSGPIVFNKALTVDASDASDVTVSGTDRDRVFIVEANGEVTIHNLAVTDGQAYQLGGGILNNGALTLDTVAVHGNTMTTDNGDFWQGGGGIYTGEGGTLTLVDSTVADNHADWSGGGIYGFLGSTTTIVNSTISGNSSNDTGGAIRTAGDLSIVNSTISGNSAAGWHGGAIFHTDAALVIDHSTITDNRGPDAAPSAIFLGTWTDTRPTLDLSNSIVAGNPGYACELYASGGTVVATSGGGNVLQDDTCKPAESDVVTDDAGLEPLADNGGPTLTHALIAASPALNAAGESDLSEDQRGLPRPSGAAADAGAYEVQVVTPTPTPTPTPSEPTTPVFVPTAPYTKPGLHTINGRQWSTTCETYSQTQRCRTEIWASVVKRTGNTFTIERGWAFNNLTYLPYMTRAQWATNPLGHNGQWTAADGTKWRTECDTPATGGNGCRTYRWTTVYNAVKSEKTGRYDFTQENKWVVNNIVMFKAN
ncbi:family 16 glycosylhydrolase [Tessaracoccus flavus]|uniref:Uncharacterized protein n=1 Tax=Tessaracoccus flavus TaxID=1610493 RepID=A0A1Q2CBE4_9ACTN|nr:family 16 glycosylhydrolase [Tessaracoccus flavus]AQP43426.1 hypothetical protein RPIT_00140 [Tessaracoccus flavus]SDZ04842.1 polymorphic outer membrane protein repeat-containing protein [Tessaracoccus flavus]